MIGGPYIEWSQKFIGRVLLHSFVANDRAPWAKYNSLRSFQPLCRMIEDKVDAFALVGFGSPGKFVGSAEGIIGWVSKTGMRQRIGMNGAVAIHKSGTFEQPGHCPRNDETVAIVKVLVRFEPVEMRGFVKVATNDDTITVGYVFLRYDKKVFNGIVAQRSGVDFQYLSFTCRHRNGFPGRSVVTANVVVSTVQIVEVRCINGHFASTNRRGEAIDTAVIILYGVDRQRIGDRMATEQAGVVAVEGEVLHSPLFERSDDTVVETGFVVVTYLTK